MLERFDSCYATVVGSSAKGLFLKLDNGEGAFAFYNYLPKGTKVLITKWKDSHDRYLTRVKIDSVIDEFVTCVAVDA